MCRGEAGGCGFDSYPLHKVLPARDGRSSIQDKSRMSGHANLVNGQYATNNCQAGGKPARKKQKTRQHFVNGSIVIRSSRPGLVN